jgi:glycosyltransferase involved in cell wall biosynthesis
MRVAVVIKTNAGGQWILPQVAELLRRGHEVVAVLPAGPGRLTAALTRLGAQVVESPFDFGFRPRPATVAGLWRLRALLSRLRPDAVHYHLYASALAVRIAALGLPAARVHMVPGPLYLESPVVGPVERVLARLDHAVIGGCGYTTRRYARLGYPAGRLSTIPYGVDVRRMSPHWRAPAADSGPELPEELAARAERRAKARAELGIDDGAFVAIMVAYVYAPKRLVHRGRAIKGHDIMLRAWRRFHAEHPRSHLLLVGGGHLDSGVAHRRELIRAFNLADDHTVSWVDSVDDVRPYYDAADVSVSPSLSENHGAAAEAGAMGVPSIVSDAGGLPETLDPDSGWVVPRGDVPALVVALRAAHDELRAGLLDERGPRVRRHIVAEHDCRRSAARVADVLERYGAGVGRR